MCRYKHLTLEDREGIMVMYIDGKSIAHASSRNQAARGISSGLGAAAGAG